MLRRVRAGAYDVEYIDAARLKVVGDQGAMALPPDGFGAHDGGALAPGKLQQALDARVERRGLHVVGVAAKGGVAPGRIGRIGARLAAAAELGEGQVLDTRSGERAAHLLAVEL